MEVNKPKKNLFGDSGKTTIDNKLNMTALNLGIAFEYGVNFKERSITISTDIDSSLFTLVDIAVTEMESQSKQSITIKINSPGGEVYSALAIVGRLKRSKCHIVTEGYGAIMSAATMILACGDKRKISKYAWFMHHEASYGADGKHSEVKSLVAQMEREEKQWAKAMESFTKKDFKFWHNTGISKDAYYEPNELLEMGVVDEVI